MVCSYDLSKINVRARAAVRDAWVELLGRVGWDLFITLTLDPRRYARSGQESWLKAWEWFLWTWCKETAIGDGVAWEDDHTGKLKGPWANGWRHGRRPMWVLVMEPHDNGKLHAHVLLKFNAGGLLRLDWAAGQAIWEANRGKWCRFEVPRSQDDVCGYVAKYVLKGGDLALGSLVLSDNFQAPRITPAAVGGVSASAEHTALP